MMVPDSMDLAACRTLHSKLHQRYRGEEGEDHGCCGRSRGAFIPRDVLIMVAEIQADLPLDHRIHEQPHDREHGQGRNPFGFLQPHGTDGGGIDGSCVVAQRGPALSRATVATSSRIVRVSQEDERPTTRDRCVYKQARRAAQGADNPLRDPTTGCWVPLRRLKRGPMELSAPSRYATGCLKSHP